jgi:hypothetical protein
MRRSAAQLMRATANAVVGHTRTAALPAPASVAAVPGSLHACNEHCAAQYRQTHIQQLRCFSGSSGRALAGADHLRLLLMYVCVMAAVNGMQTGVVTYACVQLRRAREHRSYGGRFPSMCLPATLSWHRQLLQTQRHRRMLASSRKLSRAATVQQQTLWSIANRVAVRRHSFVHARRQAPCLCAPPMIDVPTLIWVDQMTFVGSDIRSSALVGAAARLGGVVKRRPRRHRPPPSDLAPAGRPVPLTNMSADQVATYASTAYVQSICWKHPTRHEVSSTTVYAAGRRGDG